MKALLIKEIESLSYYMRQMFIMAFFLMILLGVSGSPVSLAIMVPMVLGSATSTSLALDEQSGWDQQALTLPVSRHRIVQAKYLIGYLSIGIGSLLGTLGALVAMLLKQQLDGKFLLFGTLCGLGIALIFLGVQIPLLYHFGTKNASLLIMGSYAVLILGTMLLLYLLRVTGIFDITQLSMNAVTLLFAGLLLFSVVFQLLSQKVSQRVYAAKEF